MLHRSASTPRRLPCGVVCALAAVLAVAATLPQITAADQMPANPNAAADSWPATVVAPKGPAAYTNGVTKAPVPTWPPKGAPVRVEFTADDWFSACGDEMKGNAGQASQMKTKGQQEFSIFKTDPAPLKGKVVTGALLHMKTSTPDWPFRRIGVSTVSSPWEEGSSAEAYKPVDGAPCYLQAEYKKRDWSFPGSTVMSVVFGRGQTIWGFADCDGPDKDNWEVAAVDARVVKANVAGVSYGYFLYDEVGSEWEDTGNKFTYYVYPNRFIFSTQQNAAEKPWLEVWVDGEDKTAPDAVKYSKVITAGFPEGEALLTWIVPDDQGGSGVSGFQVEYFPRPGDKNEFPRYLIPNAGPAGTECRMHIHDLPFKAGDQIAIVIRAVDGAGNVGAPFTRPAVLSRTSRVFNIAADGLQPFPPSEQLPSVGGVKVGVADLLDKVNPVSGAMTPDQPKGYLGGNHLFNGPQKLVRLQGGRNETVQFQLVLNGQADPIEIEFAFEGDAKIKPSLHEFGYVAAGKQDLPDPLLPCKGTVSIPSKAGQVSIDKQQWHSLVCEIYIPHDADPGAHKGTVKIKAGGETLTLNVDLTVWHFTLPNTLSFVAEMNSYTTSRSPEQWHRLAHEHRTSINQLWYSWSCNVGLPMTWNGEDFDWEGFDRDIGPMVDGSMFAGLPRDKEPIPLMYLPFNESWPVTLMPHFQGSFWVDEAFDEAYAKEMKKAYAAFAKHADQKGWTKTLFQFFLNNKIGYRAEGNNTRTVVAPWLFDEPNDTQDFWALRWYCAIFHEGVDSVRGKAKMISRADVSYSQFERDMLYGVLDWECLGGANPEKVRFKHDEWALWGHNYFTEYGAANAVENANIQPVAWCLSAWSDGASGVLPWLAIGEAKNWKEGEATCLFYPLAGGATVIPSVRLKAFTRGEQDVEYLTLLGDCCNVSRAAVTEGMLKAIDLSGKITKTSEADAGTIQFRGASPAALWNLRTRIAKMIDAKNPPYKPALVDWSLPESGMSRLPDIGYVSVAPKVSSYKPKSDSFKIR